MRQQNKVNISSFPLLKVNETYHGASLNLDFKEPCEAFTPENKIKRIRNDIVLDFPSLLCACVMRSDRESRPQPGLSQDQDSVFVLPLLLGYVLYPQFCQIFSLLQSSLFDVTTHKCSGQETQTLPIPDTTLSEALCLIFLFCSYFLTNKNLI